VPIVGAHRRHGLGSVHYGVDGQRPLERNPAGGRVVKWPDTYVATANAAVGGVGLKFRFMNKVWIVFDDEGPTAGIFGVFDNAVDAEEYAEEVSEMSPTGLKFSEFEVPWRITDRSTTIAM